MPRDLATICLKCLSKEPPRRYASAAALADDLGRYLRGEPIAARPAGRLERLVRWARRNPAVAVLLAVTLVVATAVLGAASWLIGRQLATARAVQADLRETRRWQQQSAFSEADAALKQARARLGDSGPFWLYPAVETADRDQQFLAGLEAIRLDRFTLVEGERTFAAQMRFNKSRADRAYGEAFRDYGLGKPHDDHESVAARVRASQWATHLVAALDDWAVCAADQDRQDWVLAVARQAAPDPWSDRVRDPAVWREGKSLAELARAAPLPELPTSLLLALGERLTACGEDGIGFLRHVREQHANDFWANFTLALALHGAGRQPGNDPGLARAYYHKALEIRPQAVAVRNNLGVSLMDKGWMWDNMEEGVGPGAYTVFHQVVKSDAQFAPGLNNLGIALKIKGDWGLSVLLFQDALQIDPRLSVAHFNLGEIQAGSGLVNEAIGHYRQALAVDPDFAWAHGALGFALLAKGRRDEVDDFYPASAKALFSFRGKALHEASRYYWQAFGGDAAWVPARNPLRISPPDEARLKEATDHFRQAVRLEPTIAQFHWALGQALLARREFPEAEAEIRRSLDLLPEWQKERRPSIEGLLQRCQRLRALHGRLAAVVRGEDKPNATDCLDLAQLCFVENHYATAARLYAEALAAEPSLADDLRVGHRFNAARAAVLAGGGQGDDAAGLGESERAALRKQARDWLHLDLDTGSVADRIQAQKRLSSWREDPDLASLRDPAALERLSPDERQECRALWRDLAARIERLAQPPSYVPIPLDKAATVVTTRGMFTDPELAVERLIFEDWSLKEFEGVPFQLVDPQGGQIPNGILLYGPLGKIPPKMPKSVRVPYHAAARAIHFLSGVSGWGYPFGTKGAVSMIVRLHYEGGLTEDHPLKNGEHFADYVKRVDVPGSKFAFQLRGPQQLRYFAVFPRRGDRIEAIELVKGPDEAAPVVMAITVERP